MKRDKEEIRKINNLESEIYYLGFQVMLNMAHSKKPDPNDLKRAFILQDLRDILNKVNFNEISEALKGLLKKHKYRIEEGDTFFNPIFGTLEE